MHGGFRYGHSCLKPNAQLGDNEPRRRLGTTVSVATYEELVRLSDRYQLRVSQILDEATIRGFIEKSARSLNGHCK